MGNEEPPREMLGKGGARISRRSFWSPHGVIVATITAMSLGLVVLATSQGFSTIGVVRILEQAAVVVLIMAAVLGSIAFATVSLAGWRNPESEEEFEELVLHSEELAREGLSGEADDFLALDPHDDEDFKQLVRDALDELPDWALGALDHVPVVISDGGRRRGAYGLYQGATVARRDVHDRIVIFRDTLRRDFGHDPELLRDQVTRVVRHELAHHVGFDELGVSRLDL